MIHKLVMILASFAMMVMQDTGWMPVHPDGQVAQRPGQIHRSIAPAHAQVNNGKDGETPDKPDADTTQVGDQNESDMTDSADITDTTDMTDSVDMTDTTDITDSAKITNEAHLKTESANEAERDHKKGHWTGQKTDKTQESDQGAPASDAEVNDGQDAIPAGKPAITADAAQKTAEAHLNAGKANKVALDEENGKLIYNVQIGHTDVKVDAMTGAVLSTDNAED